MEKREFGTDGFVKAIKDLNGCDFNQLAEKLYQMFLTVNKSNYDEVSAALATVELTIELMELNGKATPAEIMILEKIRRELYSKKMDLSVYRRSGG
jgi:hypothetical protein